MSTTLQPAGPSRLPHMPGKGLKNGVSQKQDKVTFYAFYYLMTVLVIGLFYLILLSFLID